VRSDIDKIAVDETVLLRYHKIPMTALFAEARLKQERIGHFEEEAGGTHDFLRDTDTAERLAGVSNGLQRFAVARVGVECRIQTSPAQKRF
jgi:hypothetical protein